MPRQVRYSLSTKSSLWMTDFARKSHFLLLLGWSQPQDPRPSKCICAVPLNNISILRLFMIRMDLSQGREGRCSLRTAGGVTIVRARETFTTEYMDCLARQWWEHNLFLLSSSREGNYQQNKAACGQSMIKEHKNSSLPAATKKWKQTGKIQVVEVGLGRFWSHGA